MFGLTNNIQKLVMPPRRIGSLLPRRTRIGHPVRIVLQDILGVIRLCSSPATPACDDEERDFVAHRPDHNCYLDYGSSRVGGIGWHG